ncbi:hypothetical protein [Oceanithermus sp.]|uniref:hypothetical protein n=1 Tax=Oceanithermus sp. TaxID=2268145 RepID=UPI00257ADFC9|nr:hypothetical protein [Oceanithermus sp.]
MRPRLHLAFILALVLTFTPAYASLPTGLDETVDDPGLFLEVLKQREPNSQKLIYTLSWPAPVETILEWRKAGYEVRMLLPDATPPQILETLKAAGVAYRLFPAGVSPADQRGVAAAAVRTVLFYEPPVTWRIVSNASYAGLLANLAFLWEQLGDGAIQTAPSGGR